MCWRNLYWLILSLCVIAADQISKHIVISQLNWRQPIVITNFFNLTLLGNTGAAFSFLNAASGWQRWLFTAIAVVVSMAIIVWLLKLPKHAYWRALGLALILGGAIGNLWDRITLGYVIDFLQFHLGSYYWPVFNLADSAICIGAVILVLALLLQKDKRVTK